MQQTNTRRQRTEAKLTKLGIPINPGLPDIETDEEAIIRNPQDVARRAVVLYAVACAGYGNDRGAIRKNLEAKGYWDNVSPREKTLFDADEPPEQAILDASWRTEALWVLLWALGKIEGLDLPKEECNAGRIREVMQKEFETGEFINAAPLRPVSDILDETDK